MQKLSADQGQQTEIIRVEINAATINEKNEDGTYKFSDDQLNTWLESLRGNRLATLAKKQEAAKRGPAAPKAPQVFSEDDFTNE